MYASAHFDGRCAALRADDLAAINSRLPKLGISFAEPTKTPLPPTARRRRQPRSRRAPQR
jgi:hypothetical protein